MEPEFVPLPPFRRFVVSSALPSPHGRCAPLPPPPAQGMREGSGRERLERGGHFKGIPCFSSWLSRVYPGNQQPIPSQGQQRSREQPQPKEDSFPRSGRPNPAETPNRINTQDHMRQHGKPQCDLARHGHVENQKQPKNRIGQEKQNPCAMSQQSLSRCIHRPTSVEVKRKSAPSEVRCPKSPPQDAPPSRAPPRKECGRKAQGASWRGIVILRNGCRRLGKAPKHCRWTAFRGFGGFRGHSRWNGERRRRHRRRPARRSAGRG